MTLKYIHEQIFIHVFAEIFNIKFLYFELDFYITKKSNKLYLVC